MNDLMVYGHDNYEAKAIERLLLDCMEAEGRKGTVAGFVVDPPVLQLRQITELPAILRGEEVIWQGELPSFDLIRTWIRGLPKQAWHRTLPRVLFSPPWHRHESPDRAVVAYIGGFVRAGEEGHDLGSNSVSQFRDYFPAGVFHDQADADRFRAQWYSVALMVSREQILAPAREGIRANCLRFLWLRSFHAPIVIRVQEESGAVNLVFKQAGGLGGYSMGPIEHEESVPVSRADWDRLLAVLDGCGFRSLRSACRCQGYDGAQWILEALINGRYHVVDRWGGGEIREVCLEMLRLSGEPIEDIY